jgi:hypothetical protein
MPKLDFFKNIISGRLSRRRQKSVTIPAAGSDDPPVTVIATDPATAAAPTHQTLAAYASLPLRLTGEAAGMQVAGAQRALIDNYLTDQGNSAPDIAKCHRILQYPHIILEIGCGSCEVAMQIAARNPHSGIIATDLYECPTLPDPGSHYHRVAHAWKERYLAPQQQPLDNLVILKAEIEILRHLPEQTVDSVLIINPEPKIGKILLGAILAGALHARIKPGARQIVILPYCREMGVYACGGCEFDHDQDWSLGLGFLMASGFEFRKSDRIQWGVDLYRTSPYWRNSTQTDVYVCGNRPV